MINSLSLSISFGSLIALCTLIWGIYVYLRKEHKEELADPDSRKNHHLKFKRLSSRKHRVRYAARLRWSLGTLSRFFGPRAFSSKSYELCLLWAFIYPIMLGFLFFLISNQDIGGFGLFPPIEEGRFWKVPLIPILIAGITYSFYRSYKEDGFKSLIWFIVALATAAAGSTAVTVTFAFAVAGAVTFAGAVAIAGAIVGAVAVSGAIAFVSTFAVPGTIAGTVIFVGAVAFASTFAGAIRITYTYFSKKNILFLFYPLYFIFLMICIIGFLGQPWIQVNELSFGILLFLIVLPMINSGFDWLSLGLTRYLLKQSLKSPGFKKALYYSFDLAIALLSLLALIFSLFVAIKAMEWAAEASALEQPAYDLGALWQRVESQSVWQTLFSSDGWVYVMIFSTFLPSLIHGLAFGGFLLTITRPDSSKITRFASYMAPGYQLALKEKNEIAGYLARRSIANVVFPTIGVVLLAGVIFALFNFFWNIEDIGAGLMSG